MGTVGAVGMVAAAGFFICRPRMAGGGRNKFFGFKLGRRGGGSLNASRSGDGGDDVEGGGWTDMQEPLLIHAGTCVDNS